jgi:hypothetical protein
MFSGSWARAAANHHAGWTKEISCLSTLNGNDRAGFHQGEKRQFEG